MNGRSQAVRLPKAFRFACEEVFIRRQGDDVIISPKPEKWDLFFDHTPVFDKEFMEDREQLEPQTGNSREFQT